MKMNMIEVDDIIMEYLKKNAEPFSRHTEQCTA